MKIKGIPDELVFYLENGQVEPFNPEKDLPKGSYIYHNQWPDDEGTKVEGTFLVLRNGKLEEIEFNNHTTKLNNYGFVIDRWEEHNWNDNLKEGDVILGVSYLVRELDCNGRDEIVEEKTVLLKEPYVYPFPVKEKIQEAKNLLAQWTEKLQQWTEKLQGNSLSHDVSRNIPIPDLGSSSSNLEIER